MFENVKIKMMKEYLFLEYRRVVLAGRRKSG